MRTTMLRLARALAERAVLPEPIYEFGARRVPGQEHRGAVADCFRGRRYVGCDLEPGPGVDRVEDLERLTLADGTVGTALLFDTIEHVRHPWRAMAELHRCLAPGGVLVLTSVMYFPIHAHPDDYWRFTPSGLAALLEPFETLGVFSAGLRKLPHTVVGVATRGPADPALAAALVRTLEAWRRRGARSWKEVAAAVAPPALLVPAYDLFNAVLRGLGRGALRRR